MNDERILEKVRVVITRVLEEAAFVFTDALDEKVKPEGSTWKAEGVTLAFSGEKNGTFRLWVGRELAHTLAANILGLDATDELPYHKVTDALKETINIIAGNSLTELFGDTPVFNLGIPEPADPALLAADSTRPDGIWLSAEEGGMLCLVELSEH